MCRIQHRHQENRSVRCCHRTEKNKPAISLLDEMMDKVPHFILAKVRSPKMSSNLIQRLLYLEALRKTPNEQVSDCFEVPSPIFPSVLKKR